MILHANAVSDFDFGLHRAHALLLHRRRLCQSLTSLKTSVLMAAMWCNHSLGCPCGLYSPNSLEGSACLYIVDSVGKSYKLGHYRGDARSLDYVAHILAVAS